MKKVIVEVIVNLFEYVSLFLNTFNKLNSLTLCYWILMKYSLPLTLIQAIDFSHYATKLFIFMSFGLLYLFSFESLTLFSHPTKYESDSLIDAS